MSIALSAVPSPPCSYRVDERSEDVAMSWGADRRGSPNFATKCRRSFSNVGTLVLLRRFDDKLLIEVLEVMQA